MTEIIQVEIDVEDLRTRAFAFDHHNPNWVPTKEHNLFFVKAHQNLFNDLLRARGHVLLNDVLDAMGFPRTLEGSIVGWALSFHGHAYIEFTITSDDLSEALDIQFNIQGPIIDQMVPAHAISVAQFEIHNQGAVHE